MAVNVSRIDRLLRRVNVLRSARALNAVDMVHIACDDDSIGRGYQFSRAVAGRTAAQYRKGGE
ncbi:MAG: hypothetical protein GVY16_11955 [Planctomycetes bacterium]|nr:hypothetical protein [Planctomycetota bacterium]